MTWLQRYRVRSYVRNSIWILPVAGMMFALVAVRLVSWVDQRLGIESAHDPGAARDLLGILAGSMFTLMVFVSSSLLLAMQLASAQLTPRVIGLVFKDSLTKGAMTLFAFTFTFALSVEVRIRAAVPQLSTQVAAYSCLLSFGFFLFLINHLGKFLRPSGVLRVVATLGREVIRSVYPRPFEGTELKSQEIDGQPTRTVLSKRGGVVLALDVRGLVLLAQQYDCVIELVPQVGDFVAVDEPLFRVFGGGADLPAGAFYDSVAVGSERTLEQDPAFVFRIIVDIASKGLSPAINDPTTAVLAIDQIHHLLRDVGRRMLDEGHVRDSAGRTRLVYPTPDWEDFVPLAVTEIRQFGCTSIQIARRLRAMLDNLILTLPAERVPALRRELSRLERTIERYFPELDDRALAEFSDSQGMGGKRGAESGGRSADSVAT
jgi:uncharacterized membrane protein